MHKRKALYTAVAVCSLGANSGAIAQTFSVDTGDQKIDFDIGGYILGGVSNLSSDIDNPAAGVQFDVDGLDSFYDGELHFTPSVTLDNGLTVGATAELEWRSGAGGTADTIDEGYLFVEGDFGRVEIGDMDSAGRELSLNAPNFAMVENQSEQSLLMPNLAPVSGFVGGVGTGGDYFRGTLGETSIENERNNDAGRLAYYSPSISGLTIGISYARDAAQNTLRRVNTEFASASEIIDLGVRYSGEINDEVSFEVSARYGTAKDARDSVADTDIGEDPSVIGVGVVFDIGAFTVGGSFGEQKDAGDENGEAFDLGVGFVNGDFDYSLTYFSGENIDEESTNAGDSNIPLAAGASGKEEIETIILGANYRMGEHLSANGFIANAELDEDRGDGAADNGGNDVSATVIGIGFRFDF